MTGFLPEWIQEELMRNKKAIALMLTVAALTGFTLSGCGNKINEEATFATLGDTTITMVVLVERQ